MPDNRGGPELYGYQMPQRMQPRNALGALVGGIIADADQAKFRTQRDAWIEAGAQRLEAIGTPRASQLALKLRDNPAAIHMMVKQRGGWPALEAGLQAEAENMRFSQVMEQNAAGAYSDPSSFVAAMTAAGMDPGRAAQVWSTLQPGEQGPLVEVADPGSPTGTRWVTREQAIGQAGKPPTGMRLEIGPDGTVIQTGVRGGGLPGEEGKQLQKPVAADVQKKIIQAGNAFASMKNIERGFKESFLQVPEQLQIKAEAWAERWLKYDLSPEQEERLTEYEDFASNVYENMNATLNALSGAAVSEHEMKRLKQQLPTMEISPTQFKGRMRAQRRRLALAIARYNHILNNGLSIGDPKKDIHFGGIPLDDVEGIMKKKASSYIQEIMKSDPNLAPEDAAEQVDRQLTHEFGVGLRDLGR